MLRLVLGVKWLKVICLVLELPDAVSHAGDEVPEGTVFILRMSPKFESPHVFVCVCHFALQLFVVVCVCASAVFVFPCSQP